MKSYFATSMYLNILINQTPTEKGKEIHQSFMTFEEATSLYLSYHPSLVFPCNENTKENVSKK